jgi:hypothetical protein
VYSSILSAPLYRPFGIDLQLVLKEPLNSLFTSVHVIALSDIAVAANLQNDVVLYYPIYRNTFFGCQFFGVDSTCLDNRIGVAEGACNRGYFPGTTQTAPSIVHEVRELEEA